MATNFNFAEFKTQFDLRQSLTRLTDFLAQAVDANGARLLPNGPNDLLPQLVNSLQLAPVTQPLAFDFALANITIKEVEQLANRAQVSFVDNITSKCGRAFYNTNLANANAPVVYREMSRPEASDFPTECAQLLFLDTENTIVDWSLSLPQLKTLATDRIYTMNMAKKMLMKLVNKYHPDQTTILSNKTANDIALFLLRLDANRDKTIYYRQKLYILARQPHDDLQTALAKATVLIDKIYPATNAALQTQRTTSIRTAILSFLPDALALPIIAHIQKCHANCDPLADEQILLMANQAEEFSKIRPTTPLQYGRPLNNNPIQSLLQLNSTQIFSYPLPYANPYNAYPPYAALTDIHTAPPPHPHQPQQPLQPATPPPPADQLQQIPIQPPLLQPHLRQPLTQSPPQTATLIYTHPETTNPQPTVTNELPQPMHSIKFDDVPNKTKVYKQNDQFLAWINNRSFLIPDHPNLTHKSPVPRNLQNEFHTPTTETPRNPFKTLALPVAKRTRSKDKEPQLNAMNSNTRPNSKSPYRPYNNTVQNKQQYTPRQQTNSRPTSQNNSRSNSRYDSRSRSQNSKSRPSSQNNSTAHKSRNQSKSPNRQAQQPSSNSRPSRPTHRYSSYSHRDRSISLRRAYPQMQKGYNCSPTYNPYTKKQCTKCMHHDHHEFECATYERYNPQKCTFCQKGHHQLTDCQENPSFPPTSNQNKKN